MNALNKETTLAPASLLPKPYSRLSSSIGTKGGRLQLSVGFTVSMCELRRTVGFLNRIRGRKSIRYCRFDMV